jgi:uncharacterized protein (TIGR02452 family)
MANRNQRAKIANETLKILERGSYDVAGETVAIAEKLDVMRRDTILYTPSEIEVLLNATGLPTERKTTITVRNCTTFAAARELIEEGYENPLCLNFASAKSPGGGFISGSQAQEECLVRASGLYASLSSTMTYYEANRAYPSSLYTNNLIYSPKVPVFRADDDTLLRTPYYVSMLTSPAVNAGAVRANEPLNIPEICSTMETRIRSVLAVAREQKHNALVLGAWGCGVFANEPSDVAYWFSDAITNDPRFTNAFDRIIFGVLDYAIGTPTYEAFQQVFV